MVFRYLPPALRDCSPEQVDDFQLQLRRAVVRSGDYYLVPNRIDHRSYLRTTIINPLTTEAHLRGLLDCLRTHGEQLLERIGGSG